MSRFFFLVAVLVAASIPTASSADDLVVLHSRIYNFPGQQLCQVDHTDRRYRDEQTCHPDTYFRLHDVVSKKKETLR